MENNNKDLMGWDAPGSNNHNDEEKKRSQDNDPWGRSSRSSNDEFNFSKFIDELMEMLGFKKKGSGSSGKTSKSSFNVIPLVALIVLGFYAFTGFYTVKEAERGVVLRFGKMYEVVDSGLRWKFTGIDTVNVVSTVFPIRLNTSIL